MDGGEESGNQRVLRSVSTLLVDWLVSWFGWLVGWLVQAKELVGWLVG
jgi:hypothetical protein